MKRIKKDTVKKVVHESDIIYQFSMKELIQALESFTSSEGESLIPSDEEIQIVVNHSDGGLTDIDMNAMIEIHNIYRKEEEFIEEPMHTREELAAP
tara:strand:- start:81 stop:368 length:288 start_codon:yes stop_codon:yes gene_type:complete